MTAILGVSAFCHDSAVALLIDGDLVAAAQEERFSRVKHDDGTARLQTVDATRHLLLHQVLSSFHDASGCPIKINASFNIRGEPPVCSPSDVLQGFMMTDNDALAIGSFLLLKSEQEAAT
jgi:carbamoyltransferase